MYNIKDAIQEIARQIMPELGILINAKVDSIDDSNNTISVSYGTQKFTDVRLSATAISSDNHLIITPKIGSTVLLQSVTGDYTDLVVLKINEAQSISFKQADLQVFIDGDKGKIKIENGNLNLKDLFADLSSLIKNLAVNGAGMVAGPYPVSGFSSGVDPSTSASADKIKSDSEKLLF